jgi:hypothetical protein
MQAALVGEYREINTIDCQINTFLWNELCLRQFSFLFVSSVPIVVAESHQVDSDDDSQFEYC